MAFEYRLTALRIPSHPGGAITEPMYIGTLADAGLLVYNWNGSRRISSQLGFSLVVSSRTLVPNFVSYGGYCYFQASNYSVWSGPVSEAGTTLTETILSTGSIVLGQVPLEYWDSSSSSYKGDSFYTGSIPSYGGTAVFQGRGALRGTTQGGYGSNQINVTTSWGYWTPDSGSLGKFDPQGTATGNKYFGLPQWKDQNGVAYIRSVQKISSDYTYGVTPNVATHQHGYWVIGTYNTATGWLQSSTEPSQSTPTVFTPTYPSGYTPPDPPLLTALTLTFDQYVMGSNTQTIYMLKAGIWRQNT